MDTDFLRSPGTTLLPYVYYAKTGTPFHSSPLSFPFHITTKRLNASELAPRGLPLLFFHAPGTLSDEEGMTYRIEPRGILAIFLFFLGEEDFACTRMPIPIRYNLDVNAVLRHHPLSIDAVIGHRHYFVGRW